MSSTSKRVVCVKLVKACAWCYPNHDEPKLPDGYEYTHGICVPHGKKLKAEIRELRKKRERAHLI